MLKTKRSLGRGLSALLEEATPSGRTTRSEGVVRLAIADIKSNSAQPRRHFDQDALDELTESVREHGVLQPILVRPIDDGYEIVAGERRWRASQAARLHDIPALVRVLDDRGAFEIALIENVQRADLNAIEEARSYRRLAADFAHTQESLAKIVGKARSHVANLLRLLDLPASVQALVEDGSLSMGHARAVAAAADPEALAARVVQRGLSVRATEKLAADLRVAPRTRPPRAVPPAGDPNVEALENQLAETLGLPVALSLTSGGSSGSLTIRFDSLDQLDWLAARFSAAQSPG